MKFCLWQTEIFTLRANRCVRERWIHLNIITIIFTTIQRKHNWQCVDSFSLVIFAFHISNGLYEFNLLNKQYKSKSTRCIENNGYDGNKSKYPVKNGTRAWTKTFVILYVDYEQRERPLDLKCALYVIAIASGGWLLSKQIPMNHHYCHLQQNAALFDTYKYISTISYCFISFRFVVSSRFHGRCLSLLFSLLSCIIIDVKCFSFTARACMCVLIWKV